MPFKLSTYIAQLLPELAADMNLDLDEMRELFDARPKDWRDSDEGMAVSAWLSRLRNLAVDLDSFPELPEKPEG